MTGTKQTESFIRAVKNGLELPIFVLPRSSRNEIVGVHNNSLKIKINKPPVDGQANAACCRLLAKLFGLPPSKVTVTRGHTSRRKTIRIEGLSPETALKVLTPYI